LAFLVKLRVIKHLKIRTRFDRNRCGYRRAVKDRKHRAEVKIKEHRRNFKTEGKGGR
jgi:hypothetical protein